MTDTDYPNFKLKFIALLFGPLIKWLESYHITGAFIGLVLYTILLYFFFIRNKKRVDWRAKIAIVCWFIILILTIMLEIQFIRGTREAYPFLPKRVQDRLENFHAEKERSRGRWVE